MIGAFAKIFSSKDRVGEFADVPDGTQVTAIGPEGGVTVVATDKPPAAFVEEVADEGGTVYVIPFMEAFREWTRGLKKK